MRHFSLLFLLPPLLHFAAATSAAATVALKTETINQGPVSVRVRYAPAESEDAYDTPPRVTVLYRGRRVASLVLEEVVRKPSVFITQMDPANTTPEVVIAGYTGGAHCCTVFRVVTAPPGREERRWKVVSLGGFDGGPEKPEDMDGDGLSELRLQDDRFLYRYDCYACSYAPPLILSVRDGREVNLTRRRAFRPLLRAEAERVRRDILTMQKENPKESPNGLLAGYVAVEALLGNGPAAWRFMLRHHKPQPQDYCPMPKPDGIECPVRPLEISFPLELSIFLRETGYVGRRD